MALDQGVSHAATNWKGPFLYHHLINILSVFFFFFFFFFFLTQAYCETGIKPCTYVLMHALIL